MLVPYQQSFEVNKGIQAIKIDFKGLNRQIEWLEISLVYDISEQHLTIYDSYDVELAAKLILKNNLRKPTKNIQSNWKNWIWSDQSRRQALAIWNVCCVLLP